MNILITGATGGMGNYALEFLKKLVPQDEIFALVRNKEKASQLEEKGFNIRFGNYDDFEALSKAFKDIDRLLFISGNEVGQRQKQHKNVVEAAKANGVSYIAYTSFGNANISSSPLAEDHKYTEKLILDSDINYTFLRNNWYLENEYGLITAALKSGNFVHSGGEGKVGWALKEEYAQIAAYAVSGKYEFPNIIEIGGNLITYRQLAEELEKISGKSLEIIDTDVNTASKFLQENAEYPKDLADFLASAQQIIKSGSLDIEPDDLKKYIGNSLLPIQQSLNRLLK